MAFDTYVIAQEPFPLDAITGRVWKNITGQVSFLRHAVSAPPEVFPFAHASRKQVNCQTGLKSCYYSCGSCFASYETLQLRHLVSMNSAC